MYALIHLLALGGMLSLTLANNTTSHNQLLSRQTVDCPAVFLESGPHYSFISCGGKVYVSDVCTCCSDAIGCFTSVNVCSSDSFGFAVCCPTDNPDCATDNLNLTTSAAPSIPTSTQVYESFSTTTTQGYTGTAPPTTPATTQAYSSSPTSSSQSVFTGGSNGPPPHFCGQWEILALLFVFQFI